MLSLIHIYASAVYVPEIWPTEAKLRGSGLANAVGRISGIAAVSYTHLVQYLGGNNATKNDSI